MSNIKKREIKLAQNRQTSSESTIEIEFKLRQSNGWVVYNESGESEVSLSVQIYQSIIYILLWGI